MVEENKAILQEANAAITKGDNEGFLNFCTEDTEWIFIGDNTLPGKAAVREWMAKTYREPPKFMVSNLFAGGDFVTALGNITLNDETANLSITLTATFGNFAMERLPD